MTEHVKIYGVKPRIQYVADGSLTTYDFPFATFDASNIEVYLQDIKQATNTYTVLDAGCSDGGSIVFNFAPTSGTVITIVRNLSIERTSDFQEGSTLRAKVLNDELDYQIACQQQIADNLNRSMVLPPYATDAGVDLTLPTPNAGKAIVWNADGTNLENSTVAVNALESTLLNYKTAAETAAITATTKAGIASDKADIATTQAQIATAQADIATTKATEVANALSTKANKDMDNLTQTGKTTLVSLCIPDYSAGISITQNTNYTLPSDGLVLITATASGNGVNTDVSMTIKNEQGNVLFTIGNRFQLSGAASKPSSICIPLSKGMIVNGTGTNVSVFAFYPMKGV